MKLFFKIFLMFFVLINLAIADGDPNDVNTDHTDYFNILDIIIKQPAGANYLKPISESKKKTVGRYFQ